MARRAAHARSTPETVGPQDSNKPLQHVAHEASRPRHMRQASSSVQCECRAHAGATEHLSQHREARTLSVSQCLDVTLGGTRHTQAAGSPVASSSEPRSPKIAAKSELGGRGASPASDSTGEAALSAGLPVPARAADLAIPACTCSVYARCLFALRVSSVAAGCGGGTPQRRHSSLSGTHVCSVRRSTGATQASLLARRAITRSACGCSALNIL
mmetsp:Transcript_31934/g.96308  ORF Transcript_31934/g.96308 Transcript_31934/m.96308 type:complete len:214 (+) Transcript_31934:89-730(+)